MNEFELKGRTAAVIDLSKLRSNIENIRKRLNPNVELMVVMKGDGYRHGIAGLYPTLKECGITGYAVAIWEEGKMLREAGCNEPILILGDTREDMLEEALKYDLDLTVFSLVRCTQYIKCGKSSRKKTEYSDQNKYRNEQNRISRQ